MYQCPVCAYDSLDEPPRSARTGGGSYEICRSCGFQFGVTDDDRGISYDDWRTEWINAGMPWRGVSVPPPPNWAPEVQLRRLGG